MNRYDTTTNWIHHRFHLGLLATACILVSAVSMPLVAQEVSLENEPSHEADLIVEGAILKTIETTALAAQVAGLIESLGVKEGSRTTSGVEVARIRDASVRLQIDRTRIALELAKKKYESDIDEQVAMKNQAVASNEYQRAMDANAKINNVYPPNEIDRLKLILDRSILESARASHQRELARLEAAVADAEYRQNQELLQRHQVLAPCAGMVVAVEKRIGEWVEPGTAIIRVVEIDRLRVEGFLRATDASPDLMGSTAELSVEIAGKTLETTAEVVFVSPEVNPLNSQVRVFLEVDNRSGKLRPGFRPRVVLKRIP